MSSDLVKRILSGNRLTLLDVGLFDKNRALYYLYVDESVRKRMRKGMRAYRKNKRVRCQGPRCCAHTAIRRRDLTKPADTLTTPESAGGVMTLLPTFCFTSLSCTLCGCASDPSVPSLVKRSLGSNQLSSLAVGLFDENTKLRYLYVEQADGV